MWRPGRTDCGGRGRALAEGSGFRNCREGSGCRRGQGMSDALRGDVAIIGMACIYPGAGNIQQFWENIIHKVDAISDPPEDWEAGFYFDPDADTNDRTYCKRGGYLGKLAQFNPV